MLHTLEGIFENGSVRLSEPPPQVGPLRVLVTFLPQDPTSVPSPAGMIRFGMFKGDYETTEEDFKLAEWHGEPELED